jgi:hypothetical protein
VAVQAARQKANDKEAVRLAEEARVEEERAKKSQEEFDEWKASEIGVAVTSVLCVIPVSPCVGDVSASEHVFGGR